MNLKKTASLLTAFLLVLFFSFGAFSVKAADNSERQYHILFISSYGFYNAVVPPELAGFEAGLDGVNIQISYEFMDSNYYYSSSDINNFERYISYKYHNGGDYDMVAAADDQALRFVNNHRSDLFKGLPIVFMGVNNITEASTTAALTGVTGIAEVVNIEENYQLIKRLFPERDNLVAVVDATIEGQGNYVEFMKFKDTHPDISTTIINTSYYTVNGLKEVFGHLTSNDVVLFLDFSIDGENNKYSLENAATFISENVNNVPVFRVAGADIEHGVLGGLSYSYYDAGVLAGNMAAKILTGTDPDSLPLMKDSISTPYFEQSEMDKFGIKYSMLPEGSTVLNETPTLQTFIRDNPTISTMALVIAVLVIIVITGLARSNNHRYTMIRTDYLTHLPNRTYLTEKIAQLTDSNTPYGIIMMDVDHFKTINDTYGHQIGDEILTSVGRILKSFSNRDTVFCRLGGDEFAAIITNTDSQKASGLCEKIVEKMRNPFTTSKETVKTSCSLGCAIYPDNTKDNKSVMECADRALYIVKERGRNAYFLFTGNNDT